MKLPYYDLLAEPGDTGSQESSWSTSPLQKQQEQKLFCNMTDYELSD